MADAMKVKFEFTMDDVVEGVERTAARSTTVGNWRSAQMLATCAGVFVFSFIVIPGPNSMKLVWATSMGLLAAFIHRSQSAGSRKRRVKQLFLERFGPTGPYVCEVEAGPKGAVVSFHENRFAHPERLIGFIGQQGNAASVRPDHRIVFRQAWDKPADRVRGVEKLMGKLASLAA